MTTQKRNTTERDGGRGSRRPAELKDQLRRGLTAYTTAAGAACLGVVALAQPAQADIIVNNNPISIGVSSTVPFQINGVTQLTFVNREHPGTETFYGDLRVYAGLGHVLVASGLVSRLAKGAVIGPAGPFSQGVAFWEHAGFSKYRGSSTYGQWLNQSGYMGFELLSSGETHFGWAHAHVSRNGFFDQITASIDQFAYDTVGNQAIDAGQTSPTTTPEPGTLTLLALGSLGLGLWRRKKEVSASAK